MDISRFQFGEFEANFSWFSLEAIVDEVFEIAAFIAESKGI